MTIDVSVLRAVFAARVQLAKETEEEAVAKCRKDWVHAQAWVKSQSQQEGSFIWFCDEFDLDASAVRRAIQERRK